MKYWFFCIFSLIVFSGCARSTYSPGNSGGGGAPVFRELGELSISVDKARSEVVLLNEGELPVSSVNIVVEFRDVAHNRLSLQTIFVGTLLPSDVRRLSVSKPSSFDSSNLEVSWFASFSDALTYRGSSVASEYGLALLSISKNDGGGLDFIFENQKPFRGFYGLKYDLSVRVFPSFSPSSFPSDTLSFLGPIPLIPDVGSRISLRSSVLTDDHLDLVLSESAFFLCELTWKEFFKEGFLDSF